MVIKIIQRANRPIHGNAKQIFELNMKIHVIFELLVLFSRTINVSGNRLSFSYMGVGDIN